MFRDMQHELGQENAAAVARREDDEAMAPALHEGAGPGFAAG